VHLFFVGLLEKQSCEEREMALIEVGRDADVLQAGAEFVADLFVEGRGEFSTDEQQLA
jgi:hypothetical protein